MKRLIPAVLLSIVLTGTAFGLSDKEYIKMKKANADFARADRNLTQVWNKLTRNMPRKYLSILRDEQREWIAVGRDEDAKNYMDMGYSRAEAYTMATNDRAEYLPNLAREIRNEY